ncbi:MAG: response regulator [Sandaracinaceae bacterium]|nr:response regulator [Sandaracinaceae bacterium]
MPTKILAVDDSATMRKILEMTFAAEDVELVTLADGAAAIEKAAESSPDVILADVSMQGVDAYAIAHAVKNNPALAKTAVIAMASQHHPFDEQKGQSAGIDAHVLKPFETQALIDLVEKVLRAPRAVADDAPPAAPPMPTSAARTTAAHIPPPPSAARPPIPTHKTSSRPTTSFDEPRIPPPPAAAPAKPVLELADEPEIEIDAPEPPPKRPVTRPIDTTVTQREMPARPIEPPAPKAVASRTPSSPGTPSAFGTKPAPQRPAAPPAAAPQPAAPAARPAQAAPQERAVEAATTGLEAKLQGLGLTGDQLTAILALSREVIEEVVWEVVPDLAEAIIKEEIARLTR